MIRFSTSIYLYSGRKVNIVGTSREDVKSIFPVFFLIIGKSKKKYIY